MRRRKSPRPRSCSRSSTPAANSTRRLIKSPAAFTASAFRSSMPSPKPWKSRSSATARSTSKSTGAAQAPLKEIGRSEQTGTRVTFRPDSEMFPSLDFSFDMLSQRLRELAFLNKGISITIEDERSQKKHELLYKGGIVSFVEHLNR